MPFEEPMDEGDIAADYQARHNSAAIELVRRNVAAHSCDGQPFGAGNCEWCGAAIPELRRAAVPGCRLCLDCQKIKERLKEGA